MAYACRPQDTARFKQRAHHDQPTIRTISLGAATGLATLLGGETPPAVRAQTHEISLLSPDHFLPGSDKKLGERAQRFTADGKTVAVTSTATEVATEYVKRPDTVRKPAALP